MQNYFWLASFATNFTLWYVYALVGSKFLSYYADFLQECVCRIEENKYTKWTYTVNLTLVFSSMFFKVIIIYS